MNEFIPKIVGFKTYHIDENWIESIDYEVPDETLKVFCNQIRIVVKDAKMPIVLRMAEDYPLEIFFFQNAKITIRYNKNNSKYNLLSFDPNEITSIQFPNV